MESPRRALDGRSAGAVVRLAGTTIAHVAHPAPSLPTRSLLTDASRSFQLQPFDQARPHRGAEHLHHLGPRAVAEFLAELGGRTGGTPACLSLLNEYGRLSSGQVRAAGGDRPLRRPLVAVSL